MHSPHLRCFILTALFLDAFAFLPAFRRPRLHHKIGAAVDLSVSESQQSPQPEKKRRGRPPKVVTDEVESPTKKSVSPSDSATPAHPPKITIKTLKKDYEGEIPTLNLTMLHDHDRELWKPSLVIVRAEGLPGDEKFFDDIKSECTKLYGDSILISENRFAVDDYDPYIIEFPDDKDDDEDEKEEHSEGPTVFSIGGGDEEEEEVDEDEEHDPELIEVWMESLGKVLRLMTRRVKSPKELTPELKQLILDGVAEYMDPDHYLMLECYRDETNMPELT